MSNWVSLGVRMSKKPAVLLVCITTVFGGAEVRVMQTARALAGSSLRYAVAVLPESPLHKALVAEGLTVEPMGAHRADPFIALGLVRTARRISATCIDSHNMQSQYWASLAAGAMPSLKRIITVHSVYRECNPRAPKRQIHEGSLRLGRLFGSEFIAVSETVAADLKRLGIPQDRITISENGVETLSSEPDPAPLFETLGWGPEAFVISIIGRLEPVKGHTFLLKALAGLVKEGEERVRILVAGDGNSEPLLKAEAASIGIAERVHFAGFREDIPNLLARTDLLCMPSLTEGMPYTALEAGRQSVPLLLSKVGGPSQVFVEEETAMFAPPADANAFKVAISRLLGDPNLRARLGAAAKELVTTRFSVDRMNDETFAVYIQ